MIFGLVYRDIWILPALVLVFIKLIDHLWFICIWVWRLEFDFLIYYHPLMDLKKLSIENLAKRILEFESFSEVKEEEKNRFFIGYQVL